MHPTQPAATRAATKGRGSQINPASRFTRIAIEDDWEHLEHDEACPEERHAIRTEYYVDESKSVVTENDSPDVGFRYSLNPYRGCQHGCSYCYARPTHEYFDLSPGLDFESKIFVKERAPELLRQWLSRPAWQPEPIMMSGVTDCYQPIERRLEITRRCLQVALEARQPICMVTKNALVSRDLDILKEMASLRIVRVSLSVTTLDTALARIMEPRTSSPAARLRTISELAAAGVSVNVLIAPVIPGLTDAEIPTILREVKNAGAEAAGYVLLRLPWTVRPVFLEWLERTQGDKRQKIEARIRDTRGGKMYEPDFGVRMSGRGEIAKQIGRTFEVFARKYALDGDLPPLDVAQFRQPEPTSGQRWLFAN
jgi:DNA repair photolyase